MRSLNKCILSSLIPVCLVSRSRLESPHPEVETDLSSKHRIEADPEVALQHLSRAFVQRFAITGTPNRDMMRVLQSRELTFRAATFVIDGADLHGMEVDELRAFIRCVPGMQEFGKLVYPTSTSIPACPYRVP